MKQTVQLLVVKTLITESVHVRVASRGGDVMDADIQQRTGPIRFVSAIEGGLG
jgi:hypothetical protein